MQNAKDRSAGYGVYTYARGDLISNGPETATREPKV